MRLSTALAATAAVVAVSACNHPRQAPAPVAAATSAATTDHAYDVVTGPIEKILSGDRAFATTNYVQQFYRDPGSRGFDASIDTVVKLLAAAGYVPQDKATPGNRLTYRIESRPIRGMVWSPLAASITLAGRSHPLEEWSTQHDMLPSKSWSTPPGGIDAEIVNVGGGSDAELDSAHVQGKIIYSERPGGGGRGGRGGRGNGGPGLVARAAAKGAVGALLGQQLPAYNQQEKNRTAINFQTNGLQYDTTAKIFAINVSLASRDTINAALAKGPLRAHVVTSTVFETRPERTVVAEIRGAVAPSERFVYSAHVQEPGANDNATGVGLLAEMARTAAVMLRAGQINPGRTITMLWGVEIQQTQRYISEDTTRAKGIKWGMSLDMVGENTALTGGTFLIEKMPDPSAVWVRGQDQHTEWGGRVLGVDRIWPYWYNDFVKQRCVDQSNATGGSWVVKANPFEGGSDHDPFLDAKIPAVLMWHFTDQNYHDDLDRINMVSAKELQHVGNCALATSLILTASDHPAYVRAAISELAGIAERRLDAEAVISRDTLQRPGADVAKERTILGAWRDYYVAAIAKIPEMALPAGDFSAAVAAAQAQVKAKGDAVIASLGGK
ncbi:MAG TPA: M28 family peptidase [Gemmatimonadales bacterium]|nr:M28 family peptidase [Gemmatimonadales bacterium]